MAATAAVVDPANSIVVNMIIADPAVDLAPEDLLLIAVPESQDCGIGWTYDAIAGAFSPPLE